MKISVKVKPGSKQERVEKTDEADFIVRVKAKPVEGKANDAVVNALAEHFRVPKSSVILLKGQTSRQKFFEIVGMRKI